jgi:hypothetical protein
MMPIIVAGGPDSRERTRDRNLSRPSVGGSTHPRHAGRNSAIFRDDALARVRALPGIAARFHGRQGSQFIGAFTALRTVFSIGFHRALTVCQDLSRVFADPFHFSPFAAKCGLADLLHGQQQIRRKLKCPTKALKGETRCRPSST